MTLTFDSFDDGPVKGVNVPLNTIKFHRLGHNWLNLGNSPVPNFWFMVNGLENDHTYAKGSTIA